MIGEMSNTGVPAESIFGGVKGAAVRQMSGGTLRLRVRQARAATQWGRKARMGLPAKCTFCGVPGKEGITIFPAGREASLAGVPRLFWEGFNIPHKNAKFIEFYTSV